MLACLRFSGGARVVLLGAFPATFRKDVRIMETHVPAVLILVHVAPLCGIETQLSRPLLVPGLGLLVQPLSAG